MKNFKFFSRILLVFVLLFVFSFNCFGAYDEYLNDYFIYDSDTDCYYTDNYFEINNTMLLIANEPNFDLNPNLIPWVDSPSYVQEIIYSSVPNMTPDDYLKVPFVIVCRVGTLVRVAVGWNLCLGRIYNYNASTSAITRGNMFIWSFNNLGSSAYSVCYSADFNLDYSVKVPWHTIEPSSYGTNGNCVYYNVFSIAKNAVIDIYGYGANYGKAGNVTAFSVYATPSVDSNNNKINYNSVSVVQNPTTGFSSGRFIPYQDDFENAYFSSFTPKTFEQVQQETNNGIWDSIKSIPDLIAEKLRGLFIPSDGFFSQYFDNLQQFFSEKLGFLVFPFEFIIDFLNRYLNIGEGTGTLHLPDFEIMGVKLFHQTDFNLKNAMSEFLGEYYNIYFAFVDVIILASFVNLALRKFNNITGGRSE